MALISVITPTYNGAKYLQQTIDSILNQTIQDIELIVVVDGSTDNTVEILNSIKDTRLKYFVNDKNRGISYSTNKCFSHATGKYLAICDHDDISLPNRFEIQYNFLEENKNIDGCFGVEIRIGEDITGVIAVESDVPRVQKYGDSGQVFARQIFGHVINNPAAMFRRSVLEKMPTWFDERVKISADLDFYENAFNCGNVSWVGLENKLIQYRVHDRSASQAHAKVARHESLKTPLKSIRRVCPTISDNELLFHKSYILRTKLIPNKYCDELYNWFVKLLNFVDTNPNIDKNMWCIEVERHWSVAIALLMPLNPFRAYGYYKKLPIDCMYRKPFFNFLNRWQKIASNALIKSVTSK